MPKCPITPAAILYQCVIFNSIGTVRANLTRR
jgi:hypothetical protein